ncbi:MAG: SDR family oxidoreductase [Alistipes sp.]|nr:SDR family oxidoreductase [Candidatus Alistipes equi]
MKTIFITGGSTGIGAASVKRFLEGGWNVCFMDINTQEASGLLEEFHNTESLLFVEGNIRKREDIHGAVTKAVEKFGRIDSVFANAGIHRSNTLLDVTDEELDLMIQTNIYGTVNTLRECVPYIVEAGGGSVVINSSDQWFIGKAHSFVYGMTKGALGQITRSLSIDLGPMNIRVNAICPGTIHTPLLDGVFERLSKKEGRSVEDYMKEEDSLYARKKMGTPEEVAELVYFLAGDKAGFCTGGLYPIDGGLVAK